MGGSGKSRPRVDDSFAISLISAYVSIASILTVYHMFALQSWSQRCDSAASNATVIAKNTASDDVLRLHADETCRRAARSFPAVQLLLVLAVLTYVTVLTILSASHIHEASHVYTLFPMLAFDVVVVVATSAAVLTSNKEIKSARRSLMPG